MSAKLKVKARLSSFQKGGKACYQMDVVNAEDVNTDSFLALMASKMNGGKAEARMFLDLFKGTIGECLLANKHVSLENFLQSGLSVKGSLEHIGDQPNKIENRVTPYIYFQGETVNMVSTMDVENVTEGVATRIEGVQYEGALVPSQIEGFSNINVVGLCLDLDPTKTDEYFALEDFNGVQKFKFTVVSHTPTLVVLKIPTGTVLPANGQYRIAGHCRNGMGADYSPSYATYGVKLAVSAS